MGGEETKVLWVGVVALIGLFSLVIQCCSKKNKNKPPVQGGVPGAPPAKAPEKEEEKAKKAEKSKDGDADAGDAAAKERSV